MISTFAVGLVRIRRHEIITTHKIQQLESYQTTLRRALWKQQRDIAVMTSPLQVNRRAYEMAIIPDNPPQFSWTDQTSTGLEAR